MRQGLLNTLIAVIALLPAWALLGCTGADDPMNLEPTITLLDATEITRNEVTLMAEITNHGTGKLSSLVFMYAPENAGSFNRTDAINDPSGIISVKLSGLAAGTSYIFYVEGAAGKAIINTPRKTFTTVPNDLPTVMGAQLLSTGPTGVIIEFDIPEDGGEPILTAGCEVKNKSTGTATSYSVENEYLKEGVARLNITGLLPNCDYTLTTFASNSLGIKHADGIDYTTQDAVVLTEAGAMRNLFGDIPFTQPTLSIAGPMNGTDFKFLRLMLGPSTTITHLDITGVDIVEGGEAYDGSRFTQDETIGTGMFTNCTSLRKIQLPSSAKVMMQDALRDCTGLETLTIGAGIIELKPSAGCTTLKQIDVSDANDTFACHEGVLFNKSMTSIIWFPRGKSGNFTLPSTLTTIASNAFSETSVTSLIIPPSVTVIERGAFAGSLLEDITLPDNLKNLQAGTFQNCTNLKSLTTGKEIQFIGDYALDGSRLENLYILASDPPFATTDAFTCHDYNLTEDCILHVPAESRDRYRLHRQWGKFSKIIGF